MNRSPLNIIPLLMGFTLCKGLDCDNGWVPGKSHCYKLSTIPSHIISTNSCKTYATYFPSGLEKNLGFVELAWMKENNQMIAVDLGNARKDIDKLGMYYSLCEATLNTDSTFQVYMNVRFDEGKWTIPNSKYILEEMDKHLKSTSHDAVWAGIFLNDSVFWTDGLKLSGNQQNLLNISPPPSRQRQCGVFSVGKKITFHDCSECRNGIETSTGNIRNEKTSTCHVITTEQTTSMITVQTSELTTETETTIKTASTSTTITAAITTEEEIASSTFDPVTTETETLSNTTVSSKSEQMTNATEPTTIPETGSSTFDQMTSDNDSGLNITNDTATTTFPATGSSTFDPPKMCYCPCRKPLNKSEFMESIQDIKIKPTEASKYIRSKTSAPDDRTSSRAIGTIATVIMAIPFAVIVLADLPLLLKSFYALIRPREP